MRKLLNDVSASSIMVAVFGLILLLMPSLANRLIVYGIGIALLVYGAVRVFRYRQRDPAYGMAGHDLFIGLVCVVSGLFMLLFSSIVISILPFILGVFLIFGAVRSIQTAFDVRRFHGLHWSIHLLFGIFFAVAGIQAIRNPFGTAKMLTRFAGAGLLLLGLYMFLANQKVNSLRSQYMSGPDIIDQDSIRIPFHPADRFRSHRPGFHPADRSRSHRPGFHPADRFRSHRPGFHPVNRHIRKRFRR